MAGQTEAQAGHQADRQTESGITFLPRLARRGENRIPSTGWRGNSFEGQCFEGGVLLKPIYYPLDSAAGKLGITKEELVHHARLGRIKIVIPKTDNVCFWIESIDPETNEWQIERKNEA